jgi:hypothetical protein
MMSERHRLVLDANILIRAALGTWVRELLSHHCDVVIRLSTSTVVALFTRHERSGMAQGVLEIQQRRHDLRPALA